MSKLKNMAVSIRERISQIAIKQNVPYKNVETEFLLERMVARLLDNKNLSNRLIFKGGYVGLRVYKSPRYTIDVDTVTHEYKPETLSTIAKETIEQDTNDGVWFRQESSTILKIREGHEGCRLNFRAGIGEILKDIQKAQRIQLDIGYGDPVTPEPVEVETPYILGKGNLCWRVYTIETTVAEKIHALISRPTGNSRAKDVFDIYYLFPKCQKDILEQALIATFKFRREELPSSFKDKLEKIDPVRLKAGWGSAKAAIPINLNFDDIFKEVISMCSTILV